jgi:formiminotetrahydrofolate cyclodeaminase
MNEFDYNRKKDKEKADQFVLANIKQSVNNNIKNYVQGATDEDVTLWNDYIKGVKKYSEFSTEERSRLVHIQNEVETAIQNET